MNKALALTVLIIIVLVPIGVMAGFPLAVASVPTSTTGAALFVAIIIAFFNNPT
jgi:hypothetical protein